MATSHTFRLVGRKNASSSGGYERSTGPNLLSAVCIMLIVSLLGSNTVSATDNIEKLLMPGPVITGHAKYENECKQCHRPLDNIPQKQLCLDCHKDIKADVKTQNGYHGQQSVSATDCKNCHSDHLGRDAQIVLLNPAHFDHKQTDFQLKGSHQGLDCNSCHRSDKKFRDAKHDCIDCHRSDDVHKGELDKDCKSCHSEQSWKRSRFDHNKTKFKLKGKHQKTACLSCHISETYTDAPTQCYSCHQVNDIHAGRFGQKCNDCHRETSWKTLSFNHDKTDYPLTGHHKDVACHSCHQQDLHKKLPTTCIGCHRSDDIHAGHNGDKCKSCHNTQSWKTRFDHDRETDFKLNGSHKDLECTRCHKGNVNQKLPTDCASCHQQDDVHQRSQGKNCQQCHNETSWQQKIVFEHDVTRFPLLGLHAATSCEECHASSNFKQTETSCQSCHRDDDPHKNKLGENCQQCHNPNSWQLWQFDHDQQTDYHLTGKHQGLVCEACHSKAVTSPQDLKISSDCISCHRKDDRHDGRFGNNCSRCHNTDSFADFVLKPQ